MNQPSLDPLGARDFALGPVVAHSLAPPNPGMLNNPPHSGIPLACNSKSSLFRRLCDGYGLFAAGADEQMSNRQPEEQGFLKEKTFTRFASLT